MKLSDRVGKADLHIHTANSDGMAEVKQVLDHVENHTDLDVIAITDHDNLRSSMAAREIWANGKYRFDFVTGVEITTLEGHIIALYVENPLPSLRPMQEVLAAIHYQGGLAIAAHPMCWVTRSLNRKNLLSIHNSSANGVYFDAMEVSGQPICKMIGQKPSRSLNQNCLHLPEVGGSDAHFLKSIGSTYTEFDGSMANDLHFSIKNNECRAVVGTHPSIIEIGIGQIIKQSYQGITATPRQLGWIPTAISFIKRIFPIIRR